MSQQPNSNTTVKADVVVLGAGPAGLAAAWRLASAGLSVVVVERAPCVGGAAASFRIDDCIVDYGPHAFHMKNPDITAFFKSLAGSDAVEVKRKSQLILDGKRLLFPLNLQEALFKISPLIGFRIVADYLVASIKRSFSAPLDPARESFESWGIAAFGTTLYRLAFGNYSERVWGVAGTQLSASLARQKLLRLNLGRMLLNLVGLGDKTMEGGVVAQYDLYPKYGIGTVFDRLTDQIRSTGKGRIFLETHVEKIVVHEEGNSSVTLRSGEGTIICETGRVISTIPLKYLARSVATDQQNPLFSLGSNLRYRDVRIIYVVLSRPSFSDAHWIYLLDIHFKFSRVSEQKNLNKESCPTGKTVLSMDISCDFEDSVWTMSDEAFFDMAMEDLTRLGISRSDVERSFSLRLRDVYPVYDLGYEAMFESLLSELEKLPNIYSVGRQGLFLNNDIHDSIDMGFQAAEFAINGRSSVEWYQHARSYIKERLEGRVK